MALSGSQLTLWCLVALFTSAAGRSVTLLTPDAGQQAVALATSDRETRAGERLEKAKCDVETLDRDDLQLGLRLGSQFLVNSQRDAGNFRYEYNWLSQKETEEDNPVRQAGTLWGLTLLHVDDPGRDLMATIRKGLKYFSQNSVEFPGGARMVNYPGQEPQKLGAVALLALAHIEVLRRPEVLEGAEKEQLEANLGGYLKALLAARTSKNNFYKFYDGKTGKHFGPTSPYYDGECLLALVKAAKYLSHDHLWPHIKASAEAGWKKNVRKGLMLFEGATATKENSAKMDNWDKQEASKRLKGYYQWGTMAWYELMGLQDPDFEKYAPRTLRFGSWLASKGPSKNVNVNTGYAFEGLIPAFVTAVRQGDHKLENKFACAIRQGMANLHSLQVGHTKAFGLAEPQAKNVDPKLREDSRAQGGAQGSRNSDALRIDTTQHQLHALLMANRLVQHQALI